MAIDLINIDNIVLANDFETWFKRTNEVIDALNPLQMYDFYNNFYATGDGVVSLVPGYAAVANLTEATTLGLLITRDVRFLGDMLIEILPEPPLGFNTTTGRLGFVFVGPPPIGPPLLGTSCTPPNNVDNVDRYIVWDDSAGVSKVVEASNMLPPVINCDHQFGTSSTPGPGFVTITIKGDLVVDGTTTTLSTVNLEVQDKNINLNHDGSTTPGVPGGDDTTADGGGITLLSDDGNKTIFWSNAGDRWLVNQGWEIIPNFSLFTQTIEPQNNNLDLLGAGSGDALSLHWHEAGEDDHWRFTLREFSTGQVAYTLDSYPVGGDVLNDDGVFVLQHSTADDTSPAFDLEIFFDSVTPTHDALISGFARNLNADLLDGCHSSQTPTAFTIPCADANGEIDAGWIPFTGSTVKEINQTAHGFSIGQTLRIVKSITPTAPRYILAQADTLDNAEAVGVVENIVDANNFELNMRGCIELPLATDWDAITTDKSGLDPAGLAPGGVYFLDKTNAGNVTQTEPSGGDISKTIFVAIDHTTAIVMNYVGGLTDVAAGAPIVTLTGDVFGTGLIGSPITATIVERTTQILTALPLEPVLVKDFDGVGHQTFEVTLNANTDLVLTPASSVSWAASAASWQSMVLSGSDEQTNSVTLIITQATGGGHTPDIKILGGSIIWDNSASQPLAAAAVGKTTVYVLINTTSNPTVWYGSRAVFEI